MATKTHVHSGKSTNASARVMDDMECDPYFNKPTLGKRLVMDKVEKCQRQLVP